MEQEQNESPGVSFTPIDTEDLKLIACPYLGLDRDPHTSIAFPHRANHCHKLGTSREIDLAHQSGYCLSSSHENCHVYKQPGGAAPAIDSQPEFTEPVLPAVALSSLDELPTPRSRLESLKLRLLSFRLSLLLFRLRLRARIPAFFSLAKDIPLLGDSLSRLGNKMPLINPTLASLRDKIPAGKTSTHTLKKVDLRLLAIPVMILLVLLATIIWWPPPGETEQDAVAVGAPIAQELADLDEDHLLLAAPTIQEKIQPAGNASARVEARAPELEPISGGTEDLSTKTAVENNMLPVDTQDDLTDSLEAGEVAAENSFPSGGSVLSADSAVFEDETVPELRQEEVEIVQGIDQVIEAETAAAAQIEAGTVDSAEDALAPAEALVETAAPDILPVAAIASIGPASGIQNPQEIYESQEPLFLHATPSDDADIVARINREQPATILGRDGSGEWILVRLNGNIEGWANAVLSGIDIPVANLPVVADLSSAAHSSPVDNVLETPVADLLPAAITGIVNIGALNVRAGPGIDFESIGVVYNKDEVSLLSQPESNGWAQVRLANGLLGWLNSNYLILPG